jgi:hypothetical protein
MAVQCFRVRLNHAGGALRPQSLTHPLTNQLVQARLLRLTTSGTRWSRAKVIRSSASFILHLEEGADIVRSGKKGGAFAEDPGSALT